MGESLCIRISESSVAIEVPGQTSAPTFAVGDLVAPVTTPEIATRLGVGRITELHVSVWDAYEAFGKDQSHRLKYRTDCLVRWANGTESVWHDWSLVPPRLAARSAR